MGKEKSMRAVFALVLMLGLALAGFAVYMAQGYINQTQAELAKERAARAKAGPMVEVYVVNKSLNFGDPLTKDDVQKIYWPANALPEKIFREEADLFPVDKTDPRFVTRPMEMFEPVLSSRVTLPGQQVGLVVAKGLRAFAIKVDAQTGVSGFLQPGHFVDVLWTGAGAYGELTRQIESKLKIIAVDQTINDDGAAILARTVTVEVTPQQVAVLAQAQSSGKLSLSLVGDVSEAATEIAPVDGTMITGQTEAPAPPAAQEAKACFIKMRKGPDVVEIPIPCTN